MTTPLEPHRIERDSLGEVRVPAAAYYGAQTQRAVENFPISGRRFPPAFIRTLGLVKWAAARVNAELGLLDPDIGAAIVAAADEVVAGELARPVRGRHLPDRLRHVDQHERQRGHRQPRDRAPRRRARHSADPPERPREPRPVVERRDSRPRSTCPRSRRSRRAPARRSPASPPRSPRRAWNSRTS